MGVIVDGRQGDEHDASVAGFVQDVGIGHFRVEQNGNDVEIAMRYRVVKGGVAVNVHQVDDATEKLFGQFQFDEIKVVFHVQGIGTFGTGDLEPLLLHNIHSIGRLNWIARLSSDGIVKDFQSRSHFFGRRGLGSTLVYRRK